MATEPQIPKTPVSPKVWAPVLTILGLGLLTGFTTALTPELFDFLGAWGPVVFSTLLAGLGGVAAYYKSDHIRNVGAVLAQDHGADDDVTPNYGEEVEEADGSTTVISTDREGGPDHRAG